MRSREARLRDGDSTVENIGKEAAQIQWKKENLAKNRNKNKAFQIVCNYKLFLTMVYIMLKFFTRLI